MNKFYRHKLHEGIKWDQKKNHIREAFKQSKYVGQFRRWEGLTVYPESLDYVHNTGSSLEID